MCSSLQCIWKAQFMSNKTIPDMKEIFRQAAEIAQQVPESMQVAAFNRALDLLTGQVAPQVTNAPPISGNSSAQSTKALKPAPTGKPVVDLEGLIAAIDTTQHPAVASAVKVLDRSLMILQIALRSHQLDGLTPPEIARILTEKFRLSTTPASVTMALGAATTLVNRVSRGKAYEYKIMGPGEEYLSHLGSNTNELGKSARVHAKPVNRVRKKALRLEKSISPSQPTKTKSGRTGPKQMLEQLIAIGFFTSPRDIAQIISHMRDNQARSYKATDLSPALTRLLREQNLERKKNEKGIFQYFSGKQA